MTACTSYSSAHLRPDDCFISQMEEQIGSRTSSGVDETSIPFFALKRRRRIHFTGRQAPYFLTLFGSMFRAK